MHVPNWREICVVGGTIGKQVRSLRRVSKLTEELQAFVVNMHAIRIVAMLLLDYPTIFATPGKRRCFAFMLERQDFLALPCVSIERKASAKIVDHSAAGQALGTTTRRARASALGLSVTVFGRAPRLGIAQSGELGMPSVPPAGVNRHFIASCS